MSLRIVVSVLALFASATVSHSGVMDETDCKKNTAAYYSVPGSGAEQVNRRLVSCVNYLIDLQDRTESHLGRLISNLETRIDLLQREIDRLEAKMFNMQKEK